MTICLTWTNLIRPFFANCSVMHGGPTGICRRSRRRPHHGARPEPSLRQRGVIRSALLHVDLAAIGRPVQALIAVRIRLPSRRNIEAFRDWAGRLPDTVGVFVVSGSEDFLLHVAVADNQHLYAFVIDKLTERPEVADVRTSVIYEHLRNPAIVPDPAARA